MNKLPSLKNKVIWITGASQGIGRQLALTMARQGGTVIATARSFGNLDRLQNEALDLEGIIIPLPADVTRHDEVTRVAEEIMSRFGQVDIAVLNAGTFIKTAGMDFRSTHMRQHFELNVMGVCHCLDALIPTMVNQQSGTLAINASLAGYRGLPAAAAYGASKAALINMAESLYTDLKPKGVDIKLINPGFVKTPLTDKNTFEMPFLMDVEPAAEAILRGLNGKHFEIRFPKVFGMMMGMLRILPYRAYFGVTRRLNQ
ncbi:SDR family NAD(P)-dependent oxidoreductase [Endozoicomonas sp. 8E]|uniref:SDR family NAD(P)-dependent oxidoreductase n=1 Tax=Endozoicomonas sp. 8E TaxID=3035692 RepID=UPI002938CFC9|nr:SDR family NAD(P)-dependent oxidoreductase [Endozoicomonas sp. 8E]WOG27274.1 SDR family NAD(P)-dependent oxidoreductase [Endozoicomonas sp. 8E]